MTRVVLPQLTVSMEDGTVRGWLVEDGARVRAGQPLLEVETDKVTLEVESPAAGVVRIVAEEGTIVPVGGTLAEVEGDAAAAGTGPSGAT